MASRTIGACNPGRCTIKPSPVCGSCRCPKVSVNAKARQDVADRCLSRSGVAWGGVARGGVAVWRGAAQMGILRTASRGALSGRQGRIRASLLPDVDVSWPCLAQPPTSSLSTATSPGWRHKGAQGRTAMIAPERRDPAVRLSHIPTGNTLRHQAVLHGVDRRRTHGLPVPNPTRGRRLASIMRTTCHRQRMPPWVGTFQTRSAYSRIERSEENQPTFAVFRMAACHQSSGRRHRSPTRRCVS